ncbi:uncharacterized protein [Amphiura filiformis]|uniref:uncharacterized protein n=1 Tax=Amphiura filiformis TaxID=82378 RepID=UPI003B21F67F
MRRRVRSSRPGSCADYSHGSNEEEKASLDRKVQGQINHCVLSHIFGVDVSSNEDAVHNFPEFVNSDEGTRSEEEQTDDKENMKEWVKDHIKTGVRLHNTLKQVVSSMQNNQERKDLDFSQREETYIREKYMKYAIVEISKKMELILKNMKRQVLKNISQFIASVRRLKQKGNMVEFLQEIKKYVIYSEVNDLEIFLRNFVDVVGNEDKRKCLACFQQSIQDFLLENIEQYQTECDFIQNLSKYMRYCFQHNVMNVLTSNMNLQMDKKKVTMETIRRINNANIQPEIQLLKKLSVKIGAQCSEHLQDNVKRILDQHNHPLLITESIENNRRIVSCTGQFIDLKDATRKIEERKFPQDGDEIHFVASQGIRANASFSWFGVNVVFAAEEIYVTEKQHWNVSGNDAVHTMANGPQYRSTTCPPYPSPNGPLTGPPYPNTTGPPYSGIAGPSYCSTTGLPYHNTTGPQYPSTTGLPYHNTTGLQYQSTTGLPYHNTTGLQYQSTTGLQYQSTTGLPYHNTTGLQYQSTTGLPYHSTTGLPYHSTTGLPYHSTTGLPYHNTTGLPYHSTTGLPYHSTTGLPYHSTTGLPYHSTTGLPYQSTTGLQYQSTTGPPYHNTTGLPYHNTTGLPYHSTTGLPYQSTTGLPYHSTTGLQYQSTTGLQYQSTTGLPYHNTTGLQYQSTTGLPYQSTTGLQYQSTTGLQYQSTTGPPYHGPTGPSYDAIHTMEKADDGREWGDDGQPGKHGSHGKSGGNVCIIATKIFNIYNLTVISHGGNGGNGQDGGNGIAGKDGQNGKALTGAQFQEKCKVGGWYFYSDRVTKNESNSNGQYVEMETFAGNKIIFSKYESYLNGQSYCIHYGAPGTDAQRGGDGGRGGDPGKGGHAGSIQVLNKMTKQIHAFEINFESRDGDDGQRGKDGLGGNGGKHGVKGNDCAWLLSNNFMSPAYYLEQQLDIEYERGKWTDFSIAYCPFHEKHARIVKKEGSINRGNAEGGWHGKNENKRSQVRQDRQAPIDSQLILTRYNNILQDTSYEITQTDLGFAHDIFETHESTVEEVSQQTKYHSLVEEHTSEHIECTLPSKSTGVNPHLLDATILKNKQVKDRQLASIISKFSEMSSVSDLIRNMELLDKVLQLDLLSEKSTKAHLLDVFDVLHDNFKRVTLTKSEAQSIYYCLEDIKSTFDKHDKVLDLRKSDHTILIEKLTHMSATVLKKYVFASVAQLSEEMEENATQTMNCTLGQSAQMYLRRTRNRLVVDCCLWIMKLDDKKQIDARLDQVYEKIRTAYIPDILATVQPDGTLGAEIHDGYLSFVPGLPLHYIFNSGGADVDLREPDDIGSGKIFTRSTSSLANTFEKSRYELKWMELYKDLDGLQITLKEPTTLPPIARKILGSLRFVREKITEFEAVLMSRFSCEGFLLSTDELQQLVNTILSGVAQDDTQVILELTSIVSTSRQADWIAELLYYKIVKGIGKSDKKLRKHLHNIQCKQWVLFLNQNISLEEDSLVESDIREVVDLIAKYELDEATNIILRKLPLSEWRYELKWMEIYRDLDGLQFTLKESELAECASRIWDLQNRSGRDLTKCLLVILQEDKHLTSTVLFLILRNFRANRWTFDQKALHVMETTSCQDWTRKLDEMYNPDKDRPIDELINSLEGDSNNSTSVRRKVRDVGDIACRINKMGNSKSSFCAGINKAIKHYDLDDIRLWLVEYQKKSEGIWDRFIIGNIEEVVFIIRKAITLITTCTLRNTQVIALLLFILNKDRGILQQISTGEGKSLIIVALAIIRHLAGQKTDVLTSSCVLAKRDAEEYRDIYHVFGATVAHNCSESLRDRRNAYGASVVYGEIGSFQRDTLLDEFYDENVLGKRTNENIIIDEVDSMLLDKGQNVLYLSHSIPGLDTLEQVYVKIWIYIHSRGLYGSEEDIQLVKEFILADIQGYTIMKEQLKQELSSAQTEFDVQPLWSFLVRNGIIGTNGQILVRTEINKSPTPYKFTCPESILSQKQAGIVSCILQEVSQREPEIAVPNFLLPFVHRHLEAWSRNAFIARTMKEGEQYIIDVDRSESDRGKPSNVIIMDNETGTEQYNTQWHQGLHQFLQLKHGCRLSFESLKAVFMSNITFFKRYSPSIYGLTGTLGSEKERDLLQDLYDIDYVTIPTFRPSRFIEEETIVCNAEEQWNQNIVASARKEFTKARPVLVIFETIRDVEKMEKICRRGNVRFQSYKRSYENIELLSNASDNKECILLATNLAGRGTDIKISDKANESGGLHVILTYLPTNVRIEQQAFGRSARKGQYGTGQMIILDNSTEYRSSELMKMERNRNEEHRLTQIRTQFETVIKVEEKLLGDFRNLYERLRKALRNRHRNILERLSDFKEGLQNGKQSRNKDMEMVILLSCLDEWAFALDSVQNLIKEGKDVTTKLKNNWLGKERMEKSIRMLANSSKKMPIDLVNSPPRRIKLGLIMVSDNDSESAAKIFRQVIEEEPHFAEMAHYYMVHCLIQEKSKDASKLKFHLEQAEQIIRRRIDECAVSVGIDEVIKDNFAESRESFLYSDDYSKQKEGMICLYKEYIESIESLQGCTIQVKRLQENQVTEDPVQARLLIQDLQQIGLLTKASYTSDAIEKVQRLGEYYDEHSMQNIAKCIEQNTADSVSAEDFISILPSREELWEQLKISGLLQEEKEYVLLKREDFLKSKLLDSSTKSRVKDLPSCPILRQFVEHSKDDLIAPRFKRPVLLYPEYMDTINIDKLLVLERSQFESIFGPFNSWQYFVQEKVIMINKLAYIRDQPFTILHKYDTIDESVFTLCTDGDIEISRGIFHQLRAEGVISYIKPARLKTDDLDNITLTGYEEYVSEVQKILRHHCSYRLALYEFFADLEATTLPIESNPHERLFDRMVYHKIIQPVKIKNGLDVKGVNAQLERLQRITKEDFQRVTCISSEGNGNNTNDLERTRDNLHFISFMVQVQVYLSSRGIYINISNGLSLKELSPDHVNAITSVIGSMKLAIPIKMMLYYKINGKTMIDRVNDFLPTLITKMIEKCDPIMSILVELACLLDNDTSMSMSDELLLLSDNGFDRIIQIGDAKWTLQTNLRIAGVLAIGAAQIIAGAALEAYTAGAGTFVANALISEGMGDIMFGFGSAISGHCSVESYWQNKKMSLYMTTICVGVGACWAKGATFSRYSRKIGGTLLPNHLTGKHLIKEVGMKRLGREIASRAGKKMLEASLLGAGNAVMNKLAEMQYVRNVIQKPIVNQVLKDIDEKWSRTGIDENIRYLDYLVGQQEARRLISNVLKNIDRQLREAEKKKHFKDRIVGKIKQGFENAENKLRRTKKVESDQGGSLLKYITMGFKIAYEIYGKYQLHQELMEDVQQRIDEINEGLRETVAMVTQQQQIHSYYHKSNAFVAEMRLGVKNFISSKLEKKVTEEIVLPVSQWLVSKVTKSLRKRIKNQCRAHQNRRAKEHFHKLKHEHYHKVAERKKQKQDNTKNAGRSTLEQDLEIDYREALTELCKTTKDPELIAEMIKEGMPLGIEGVQAIAEISGRQVIVHQPGIDDQTISSTFEPDDQDEHTEVPIEINFQKDIDGNAYFTNVDRDEFHCPLNAVMSKLDNSDISRDTIAETIKSSSIIRDRIERGNHEHFMDKGLICSQKCKAKPKDWLDVERMIGSGSTVEYWKGRSKLRLHTYMYTSRGAITEYSAEKTKERVHWFQSAHQTKDGARLYAEAEATRHTCLEDNGHSATRPALSYDYLSAAAHIRIDQKYVVSRNVSKEVIITLSNSDSPKEGIYSALATFCESTLYEEEVKSQSYLNHLKKQRLSQEEFSEGLHRECYKVYQVAKFLNDGKIPACTKTPTLHPNDPYKVVIAGKLSRVKTLEDIGKIMRTPAPCTVYKWDETV